MRSAIALVALVALAGCSTPPHRLPKNDPPPAAPDAKRTTIEDLRPFLKASTEKAYPIYPGDVVEISVQGREEFTIERMIPPDGKIPLYKVEIEDAEGSRRPVEVVAAGKQITELEEELRQQYSRVLTSPYVTVRVTQFAPKVIYVAGEVKSPKDYQLRNDRRISLVQALVTAGWFTENAADDSVRIIRTDPKTGARVFLPPIDVRRIVTGGEVELDIPLEPGDLITVGSRKAQSVFIFGHVVSPGEFDYEAEMTLMRLITRAGGLKEFAKVTDIRVLRDGSGPTPQVFHVDMKEIFNEERPDFRLRPGDVIYVDETFI